MSLRFLCEVFLWSRFRIHAVRFSLHIYNSKYLFLIPNSVFDKNNFFLLKISPSLCQSPFYIVFTSSLSRNNATQVIEFIHFLFTTILNCGRRITYRRRITLFKLNHFQNFRFVGKYLKNFLVTVSYILLNCHIRYFYY